MRFILSSPIHLCLLCGFRRWESISSSFWSLLLRLIHICIVYFKHILPFSRKMLFDCLVFMFPTFFISGFLIFSIRVKLRRKVQSEGTCRNSKKNLVVCFDSSQDISYEPLSKALSRTSRIEQHKPLSKKCERRLQRTRFYFLRRH